MMEENGRYMHMAANLSAEAIHTHKGGPFGAVVVKDGQVVGKGCNNVQASNDPTAHAEVEAIRDACRHLGTPELVGCHIYTSAQPCPMCLAAIYWACIGKVYYANTVADTAAAGFDDSVIYHDLQKPLHERKVEMIHLPDERAAAILEEWKALTGGAGKPAGL